MKQISILLILLMLLAGIAAQHKPQSSSAYKSYVARLDQFGDDSAPRATVIYSNLGADVVWTRETTGQYHATSDLFFPGSNTVVFISGNIPIDTYAYFTPSDGGSVFVRTIYDDLFIDGISNCNIEIRVY